MQAVASQTPPAPFSSAEQPHSKPMAQVVVKFVSWLPLIGIVIFGFFLRWVFMIGPIASDDSRYVRAAQSLANLEPIARMDHAYVRAAFVVWLAIWIKLGAGIHMLALADVLLSTFSIVILYRIAHRLTDRSAARWSAFLWACGPLELLTSGLIVPDHLALLLAMLATEATLGAFSENTHHSFRSAILAGVFSGLAVSAKEPYFLLPAIFGIWAMVSIRPMQTAIVRSIFIGVVAIATFSLEFPFFRWWTGHWDYRFLVSADMYGVNGAIMEETYSPLVLWAYYPLQLLANPYVGGLMGWLLILASCVSLKSVRHSSLIVLWFCAFFLFLQYGSTGWDHYQPVPKQWRYLHPIVILLFIPLGRWFCDLVQSSVFGWKGMGLMSCGLVLSNILLANERAAQGFYSEGSVRCIQLVNRDHEPQKSHLQALPLWSAKSAQLDMAKKIKNWQIMDLDDGLSLQEATRLARNHLPLLIPEVMWLQRGQQPALKNLRLQLQKFAASEPLFDWQSPLDRLMAKCSLLKPYAQKTVIGYFYTIDPVYLADWPE